MCVVTLKGGGFEDKDNVPKIQSTLNFVPIIRYIKSGQNPLTMHATILNLTLRYSVCVVT